MKLMSVIRYRKTANNVREMSGHGQYAKIRHSQKDTIFYQTSLTTCHNILS